MPLNISIFKSNLKQGIANAINDSSIAEDPMWGPKLIVDEYFKYISTGVVDIFPLLPVVSPMSKKLFLDEFVAQVGAGNPDPFTVAWFKVTSETLLLVGGATAIAPVPFLYSGTDGIDNINDFVDLYGDAVDNFTKGIVFALPPPLKPATPF